MCLPNVFKKEKTRSATGDVELPPRPAAPRPTTPRPEAPLPEAPRPGAPRLTFAVLPTGDGKNGKKPGDNSAGSGAPRLADRPPTPYPTIVVVPAEEREGGKKSGDDSAGGVSAGLFGAFAAGGVGAGSGSRG
ncbi:hypothetical protein G7Z17_g6345 [Cylindrodendrum hubeiense]|uniref:Uncharacterized protein n=1 Tax=Cylindrodendrum hubeiense TaxID=595255 RepID=A0A9P5HDD2_9HYPO|nr:hypothetical protein G7Z17_g6345 [Cylindrodendrum hubeiense]